MKKSTMKKMLFITQGLLISVSSFSQTEYIDIIVNQKKIKPDSGISLNKLESFAIYINDKEKLFEPKVQNFALEFILAKGSRAISRIQFSNFEDIEFFDLVRLLKNKGSPGGRLILEFKSNYKSSDGVVITIPFQTLNLR